MPQQPSTEILLNEEQVADTLGLTVRTLQAWRLRGKPGLPFIRLSRRAVRYRRSDVEAFVENCLRTSTSDPGRGEI